MAVIIILIFFFYFNLTYFSAKFKIMFFDYNDVDFNACLNLLK